MLNFSISLTLTKLTGKINRTLSIFDSSLRELLQKVSPCYLHLGSVFYTQYFLLTKHRIFQQFQLPQILCQFQCVRKTKKHQFFLYLQKLPEVTSSCRYLPTFLNIQIHFNLKKCTFLMQCESLYRFLSIVTKNS